MLFFTGIRRTAATIAQSYAGNVSAVERQLREISGMVDDAADILAGGSDFTAFGRLLHETWDAKRSLSRRVSNSVVDDIYQAARGAGAIGGKLLGAGGGGFMLLFAAPSDHARIRERLRKLVHVPFRFERGGSRILVFDPEQDYGRQTESRVASSVEAFQESGSAVELA
jgi:D-glycero-alpha-D-manno-heptose-7-phosphate kinase